MPIRFSCPCGKEIQARDEQAGKRVRCPKCQQPALVPDLEDDGQPVGLEKLVKCPKCQKEWPEEAVLCVNCGFNFKTGKKLRTKVKVSDRTLDLGSKALGCYTRLSITRDPKGRRVLKKNSWFLWIPFGGPSLDLTGYEVIAIDYTPGEGTNVPLALATGIDTSSPDVFYIKLEGTRKKTITVFEGTDDDQMREIVDMLQEATGFRIERK